MSIPTNYDDYRPILKTTEQIAKAALKRVQLEATGKQLGLRTRFGKLNVALGKYLRFSSVTSINGLSGSGKSYLLNLLLQDFINPLLNEDCVYDYIIASHSFEMLPEDEILRTVSGKLKKSYMSLLSSDVVTLPDGTITYNNLSAYEIKEIEQALEKLVTNKLVFFDEPTTLEGISKNILLTIEYYQDVHKVTTIPKVVIPIDHTLLIKQSKGEKQILDTMRSLASYSIALKKKGYCIILLGQLNNKIEDAIRIQKKEMHYPIKSDIYAQAEIFNACDNVMTTHQPAKLGIIKYGVNERNTQDLFHLQVLKQRFGKEGHIWLKNDLGRGQLISHPTYS